ncbi:SufE family protein [Methylobacterium iners]|uniref:Cysteine desulfuration protein SufE n=1 Tax=Methylobacterium iners TaxID=418707 RepID=A0ABQ4S1Q7_9HYPH|nr:SufE family protein [Methylobacterium iners]GJD97056.1 Cysteine desulfuration protein SufE [Methylobacterium iners]
MLPPIETIIENFSILDEGMDRYEYLIELGRALPPFPQDLVTEENRVHGCESQVWVDIRFADNGPERRAALRGTSDSVITKGLIALVMAIYGGKTPREIADIDVLTVFKEVGLGNHLTSKRANGVRAMADRIRHSATRLAA